MTKQLAPSEPRVPLDDLDPLHETRPNDLLWSRANVAEACPGVLSPLGWSFWRAGLNDLSRVMFWRMGVMTRAEATRQVTSIEDTMATVYFGRAAANVDWLRRMMDRLPGADADQFEASMLGSVRPNVQASPTRRRLPAVVGKAPIWMRGLTAKAASAHAEAEDYWRRAQAPGRLTSTGEAVHALLEAFDIWWRIQLVHGPVLNVGQTYYGQVAALCAKAGLPGLELRAVGHGRGVEELNMVRDLERAAVNEMTVADIVARYGFHGPDEGEISARVWREDSTPLASLVESYRAASGETSRSAPDISDAAERELLLAVPRSRRAIARFLVRQAATYVPLREVTKGAFLQALDGGRIAARALGTHLAVGGLVDDPEDVFLLTLREATTLPHRVDHDEIDARRQRRIEYSKFDVPLTFIGSPESKPTAVRPRNLDQVLQGVAASAGRAEGTARVITDPHDAGSLEFGEVLICHTTDPSWVPFFHVAAAVVVDIGGPLSHAAIVARELGVPAVVNCVDATLRIPPGARVSVDGSTGEVRVAAGSLQAVRPDDAPSYRFRPGQ